MFTTATVGSKKDREMQPPGIGHKGIVSMCRRQTPQALVKNPCRHDTEPSSCLPWQSAFLKIVEQSLFLLVVIGCAAGLASLLWGQRLAPNKATRVVLLSLIVAPLVAFLWIDMPYHDNLNKRLAEESARAGFLNARILECDKQDDSSTHVASGSMLPPGQTQTQSQQTYILCGNDSALPKAVVLASKIRPDQVESVIKQDEQQRHLALNEITSIQAQEKKTKNILVRYYAKRADNPAADSALSLLRSLGFSVVSKESKDSQQVFSTNAIWYGPGVPMEDVKEVAFCLMASGIRLQGVQPLLGPTEGLQSEIQIVYDQDYVTRDPIAVSTLKEAKGFDVKGNAQD